MPRELPPLSLYVHLPWCVRKCPYCDFNSHTAGDEPPRQRYLAALLADLDREARSVAGRELISVFLGGGTPSLFTPAEIGELLAAVRAAFALADDIEITMEANPGTIEFADPRGYRQAGVNRLSLGAQSFNDESLQRLGRIHSAADVVRAVAAARAGGFDNINLDIMYALPGQSPAMALADLEQAIALQPEHLSWYELTLEPNTVFFARPPAGLPDADASADIQAAGEQLLAAAGFARYEISAYARGERRCRHNMNYWTFGDYVAVGAGAHAKISDGTAIRRYARTANPLQYMQQIEAGATACEAVRLGPAECEFEYMLNVLRLTDAFDEAGFSAKTGLPADRLHVRLRELGAKRLVEAAGNGAWRVSRLGQRFVNDLQAAFLP